MPKRRPRVPTLGPRQLNLAEPGPRVKKRAKRQAQAQARREFAPQLQATRGAVKAAQSAYKSEVASVVGATNMMQSYLGKAAKYARKQGLGGREMKLLKRDMALQRQQIPQSIPFLTADAATERAKAIGDVKMDRAQIRADQATQAASDYGTELGSLRDKASSALKASKEGSGEGGLSDADKRKLQNASIALRTFLTKWKANKEVGVENPKTGIKELVPLQQANPLKTKAHWQDLAAGLASGEGIDPWAATKVVSAYAKKAGKRRKKQKRRTERTLLEDPRTRIDPGIQQLLGLGR